ncbi:uncharacterized protein DUF4124 [Luteibacter rhizovicinus]|uniref:Uncharacterized protein DUF4124 n=1 Tax=Luteibacter rhizovicinus TaxID=242606 RepID=A0A4R3YQC4_9GAMM|nr:DUF4124 domain-containing protein [Luteibacter rhizovicinus]TCV94997.1 uncharacterized protein DUF4124 [Luteibacter rhizovicinus]
MRRYLVVALLVSVATMAHGQAQFYKWKDAQGVTHYTDAPPTTGTKFDKVHTNGTAEAPGPVPVPAPAPAAANKAPAGTTADTPDNRKKLCTQLKANIDLLASSQPVSADDGKGGQTQLDANGRKQQQEAAQTQYQTYCK